MPSRNGKKVRFIVDLDPDDAEVLLAKLKERSLASLTDLVRKLIKREAKNPRPCQCTSTSYDATQHRTLEQPSASYDATKESP